MSCTAAVHGWLARRRHKKKPPPVTPPLPPTSGVIAWQNTDSEVSDADAALWVDAMNAQVADIQALWPHVQEWSHVFVAKGQAAPAGAVHATLRPTLPEAPGALGYHDVNAAGEPFIMIATKTTLAAGVEPPTVMSHEAGELTADPACTLTFTARNGDVWAAEIGDPVESDKYSVTTAKGAQVNVSDLVGQSFFGAGPSTLDKTGAAKAPFTIAPGGYAVINGNQVFADGRVVDHGDPDDVARAAAAGYRVAGVPKAKLAATRP